MSEKSKQFMDEFDPIRSENRLVFGHTGTMEHLKDESLMLFSYARHKGNDYRFFYGLGVVYRVVKGEKMDLIYINFGYFKTHKTRLVVATHNHARRQTMTLKRGQVCQVYGICRFYTTKYEVNGVEKNRGRLGLYALGLNGWYVPTMLDIRKMPRNEDVVPASEGEKRLLDNFESVLNEFMNGTGEDETEEEE